MDQQIVRIDLDLPRDDQAEIAMIEAAERLYPSNPLLGLFHLSYLVKLVEDDRPDRDDDWWA